MCPEDKDTVPTAEVTEFPVTLALTDATTVPKVTPAVVPVNATLALAAADTVPADKVELVPVNAETAEPDAVAVPTPVSKILPVMLGITVAVTEPKVKLSELPVS